MDLKEILPEFQTFLRERIIVHEKSIPYHAVWITNSSTYRPHHFLNCVLPIVMKREIVEIEKHQYRKNASTG